MKPLIIHLLTQHPYSEFEKDFENLVLVYQTVVPNGSKDSNQLSFH